MNLPCSVIRDLLPLYAEDLAGEESKAMVESHLDECDHCKTALNDLKAPKPVPIPADTVPLLAMKQLLRKYTAFWCLLVSCLVAAIVFAFMGRMTTAESVPYTKGVFSFDKNTDGYLTVAITGNAPDGVDYQVDYFWDESGRECMAISSYTSPLLRTLRLNRAGTVITARSDTVRHVYYCDQTRGGVLTLLSGHLYPGRTYGGAALLPRLVLNYYLFASLALAVLFFILALLLRKKTPGLTLLHIALAFTCYALAHLLIKGQDGTTYFLRQDLAFLLLTAVTLFGAVFAALRLYRLQK